MLKEALAALSPPRDGLGLLLHLLDGGQQDAGECFDRQAVRAGDLDQLTELDRLLAFDLLGLVHEGLKLGVEVSGLAGHVCLVSGSAGERA